MTITDRVLDILLLLRTFKYLTTAVIREWCVANDRDGSTTREIIRKMLAAGFVKRFKAQVVDPLANSAAPVIVPTQVGCSVLATMRKDMSLLLDCEPPPAWQSFSHNVCVSKFLLVLRAGLLKSSVAKLAAMYLEHDVINRDESDPAKRFKLYTVVQEQPKRIVCVPDALLGIQVGQFLTAYLLELERGTDAPARVAAKKSPGMAKMFESGKYKALLPGATKMRVLVVCPNAAFRDALRREVLRQNSAKELRNLWRFVAQEDVSINTILHSPVIYPCEGEPVPLVKAPVATPAGTPMAEA